MPNAAIPSCHPHLRSKVRAVFERKVGDRRTSPACSARSADSMHVRPNGLREVCLFETVSSDMAAMSVVKETNRS